MRAITGVQPRVALPLKTFAPSKLSSYSEASLQHEIIMLDPLEQSFNITKYALDSPLKKLVLDRRSSIPLMKKNLCYSFSSPGKLTSNVSNDDLKVFVERLNNILAPAEPIEETKDGEMNKKPRNERKIKKYIFLMNRNMRKKCGQNSYTLQKQTKIFHCFFTHSDHHTWFFFFKL